MNKLCARCGIPTEKPPKAALVLRGKTYHDVALCIFCMEVSAMDSKKFFVGPWTHLHLLTAEDVT